MHWVITLTWADGLATKQATSEGVATPSPGATRQELFREIRRWVAETKGLDPGGVAVAFFDIAPNAIEAEGSTP